MMQDKNGSGSGYRVPGTRYLAPMPNFPISNLSKAIVWDRTSKPTGSPESAENAGHEEAP